MKIIFCDWHRWTFSPSKHYLKQLLIRCGVECSDMKPAPVNNGNSKLLIKSKHKPEDIYRGFNIKSMIKTAVLRETKWYTKDIKIEKKYMSEAMEYIDWAFRVFSKEKPDYIVIEGGLTHFHRTILEVARELEIGIIAVENSFIKNKLFIEFNTGYVCNRHSFARSSQDWMDTRVLTKQKKKEVEKIIKEVLSTDNLKYPTIGKFNFSQLKKDKTIFVPLQVAYDQVVLYDSKFNNKTFIEKIMKIYYKYFSDYNIILKCHPTEERLQQGRQTGNWFETKYKGENIYLIRGAEKSANTQNLIRHSDLIFVNNSQAGLEACLFNKPVIVFGDAFYAHKEFTLEYNSHINWEKLKENYNTINDFNKCKIWFYYFYKWLYTRPFTKEEEKRIMKRLNIKEK